MLYFLLSPSKYRFNTTILILAKVLNKIFESCGRGGEKKKKKENIIIVLRVLKFIFLHLYFLVLFNQSFVELHKFKQLAQVIKRDHVAAGLCCIQLFINSALQEEAIKHLEHAKVMSF